MREDYTLVQIYIPGATGTLPNRAYYTTGLNGSYHAKVIGITFADKVSANDNRLIRITSDSFRKINGNMSQSIAFCNRNEHNHGNPQGAYPIDLDVVGGNIDLTLTSSVVYDNSANSRFDFCIITLEVKAIPRE